MAKTVKKKPLEVGERIWIESTPKFYEGESKVSEYEIVETNNSSAYAVRVDELEKEKPSRLRIEQKTRKVIVTVTIGYAYYLWETKEAFEKSVKHEKQFQFMKKQAIEKVGKMDFEQLKEFLSH